MVETDRGTEKLWYCCICTSGTKYGLAMYSFDGPWVGDFDAGDLFGECPQCGAGVGVIPVEYPADPAVASQIVHGKIERAAARWPVTS